MKFARQLVFGAALSVLVMSGFTPVPHWHGAPACATEAATGEAAPSFSGVADYYADYFHGKRTASGQLHDKTKLTAAHRTLPFGTKVKLVNRRSKKSCVVVINDRGPFTKNKVIDVSQEAARKLGLFTGTRIVDCYVMDTH